LSRFLALILLAVAFGACKKSSSDDDGPLQAPSPPAPPPPPPALVVDLDVDANRDGTVHATADEAGESSWTTALGAVFYFNVDDDDNSNTEDHVDSAVNGIADGNDLARIVLRQMASLPTDSTVRITVSSSARAASGSTATTPGPGRRPTRRALRS
jgi:hypothetical protein